MMLWIYLRYCKFATADFITLQNSQISLKNLLNAIPKITMEW